MFARLRHPEDGMRRCASGGVASSTDEPLRPPAIDVSARWAALYFWQMLHAHPCCTLQEDGQKTDGMARVVATRPCALGDVLHCVTGCVAPDVAPRNSTPAPRSFHVNPVFQALISTSELLSAPLEKDVATLGATHDVGADNAYVVTNDEVLAALPHACVDVNCVVIGVAIRHGDVRGAEAEEAAATQSGALPGSAGVLLLCATRAIASGEPLVAALVDTFAPAAVRQARLLATLGIAAIAPCRCPLCVSLPERARAFECPKCSHAALPPAPGAARWRCFDEGGVGFRPSATACGVGAEGGYSARAAAASVADPWADVTDPDASPAMHLEYEQQRGAFIALHCTCGAGELDDAACGRFVAVEQTHLRDRQHGAALLGLQLMDNSNWLAFGIRLQRVLAAVRAAGGSARAAATNPCATEGSVEAAVVAKFEDACAACDGLLVSVDAYFRKVDAGIGAVWRVAIIATKQCVARCAPSGDAPHGSSEAALGRDRPVGSARSIFELLRPPS